MNFQIEYLFLTEKSKIFMLDINKKIIKIKLGWVGVHLKGLRAFMTIRRKMRQFYCRKTVWLDGGKIKAVRAENIPHYLIVVSFEHPAAFTPKWHNFLYKKGKKMSKFNNNLKMTEQTGRSMVEMLGVLAIIGVLSVGGITGYTSAMRQYKANEIVNATSLLYMMGASQNQGNGDKVMLYSAALGTVPSGVSEIAYNADKSINIYFTDTDVCPLVKNKLGDKAIGNCPNIIVHYGEEDTREGKYRYMEGQNGCTQQCYTINGMYDPEICQSCAGSESCPCDGDYYEWIDINCCDGEGKYYKCDQKDCSSSGGCGSNDLPELPVC
jgi:type II secretory pathway pseudopilin PulG